MQGMNCTSSWPAWPLRPVTTRVGGGRVSPLCASPTWKALQSHYASVSKLHLRELFAKGAARAERFMAEGAGWRLDYSKHRITADTMKSLSALSRERGLEAKRNAVFAGEGLAAVTGATRQKVSNNEAAQIQSVLDSII